MEIIEKYLQELEIFYKLDETNLVERQMMLPSVKHRFVGIYIRAKIEINTLESNYKKLIKNIKLKLQSESAVNISDSKLEELAAKHTDIKAIQDKLNELDMVIKFCDKVEKILGNMTYDFKNLAELKKMEMI